MKLETKLIVSLLVAFICVALLILLTTGCIEKEQPKELSISEALDICERCTNFSYLTNPIMNSIRIIISDLNDFNSTEAKLKNPEYEEVITNIEHCKTFLFCSTKEFDEGYKSYALNSLHNAQNHYELARALYNELI